VLQIKLTSDHSFQFLTLPRKETTGIGTENEEIRAELAEATFPLHPFITERCYRALLYSPSLLNTQFADCI
jgi:hypothetical protein